MGQKIWPMTAVRRRSIAARWRRLSVSYVAENSVGVDQVAELISTVHRTLSGLGESTPAAVALEPAVPIRRSVQPDYVVCLECGFRGQTLRRHLRTAHGFEPPAYRIRWKLSPDHALVAPVYSERRSTMAKGIGLGRGRPDAAVSTPAPEVIAPPAARRRGRKPREAVVE
jgi:predicted transcriptional regulator